jgi:hypothetical protein
MNGLKAVLAMMVGFNLLLAFGIILFEAHTFAAVYGGR